LEVVEAELRVADLLPPLADNMLAIVVGQPDCCSSAKSSKSIAYSVHIY
jgi:hypothetical protein